MGFPKPTGKKTTNRKGGAGGTLGSKARRGGRVPMDPDKATKKKMPLRTKSVTGRNSGDGEKKVELNNPAKGTDSGQKSIIEQKKNRDDSKYGEK